MSPISLALMSMGDSTMGELYSRGMEDKVTMGNFDVFVDKISKSNNPKD
jgi:hypothetical protein